MTVAKLVFAIACIGTSAGFSQIPNAKILDVRSYESAGPSIVAPNNGYPVVIPTSRDMFTLTVAVDGIAYSIEVRQSRHVKSVDFIVGDSVEAQLDGKKLLVTAPSGKQIKEKIVRRERLPPSK